MLCAARKSDFVCYMQALFCALSMQAIPHVLQKHMIQTSCAARESVFLCAAYKLTAVIRQRRIKTYNEMAHKQNIPIHPG